MGLGMTCELRLWKRANIWRVLQMMHLKSNSLFPFRPHYWDNYFRSHNTLASLSRRHYFRRGHLVCIWKSTDVLRATCSTASLCLSILRGWYYTSLRCILAWAEGWTSTNFRSLASFKTKRKQEICAIRICFHCPCPTTRCLVVFYDNRSASWLGRSDERQGSRSNALWMLLVGLTCQTSGRD